MTPKAHVWLPIADLEDDPKPLSDGELGPLGRVWERAKKELVERDVLNEFQQRLWREWSIETGIIEKVFTLDRGVTQTLIAQGINAALIPRGASDRDGVAVVRIIQDHYDALEGMFDFVAGQRDLSTSYIKMLHAALLRNQDTYTVVDQFQHISERPLEKGKYKSAPNSPTRPDGSVHECCPPEHVASEMDQLVRMYAEHENTGIPPEVNAAWLHHRFTQIHPFPDGNGRVARAIASLVFIKAGWFPLIVKRDGWSRYVEALEKADAGDLRTLVAMFVEVQRNAVIQATEVAYDVHPLESADEAIVAVRDRLVQRGKLARDELLIPKQTAIQLMQLAESRLARLANDLASEVGRHPDSLVFATGERAWISQPEMMLIQGIDHMPDVVEFISVAELAMNIVRSDRLIVIAYALGPRYLGIIGIIACLAIQDLAPTVLEGCTFQINYEEHLGNAKARFSTWLERVVVEGLDQWRRTL